MKKLFLIFLTLALSLTGCVTPSGFAGSTQHKPLKKAISSREANRVAYHQWNPYTREGNAVYRSSKQWSVPFLPLIGNKR